MGRTSRRAKKMQEQYLKKQEKSNVEVEKIYTFKQHQKHMSWCLKNGIKIYPKLKSWNQIYLVIEENGIATILDELYKQKHLKPNDIRYETIVIKLYTKKYLEKNGKTNES